MNAAASWICLALIASGEGLAPLAGADAPGSDGGGAPPGMPIATGVAAPSVVDGAMAAMWLAYTM
jgi:hypothetical protein